MSENDLAKVQKCRKINQKSVKMSKCQKMFWNKNVYLLNVYSLTKQKNLEYF